MTEEEIWQKVVGVMRETLEDEALVVTRWTVASDVDGWDSLRNIELLVALQTAFGVRFNTGEMASLKNVGELVDTITRRLSAASG